MGRTSLGAYDADTVKRLIPLLLVGGLLAVGCQPVSGKAIASVDGKTLSTDAVIDMLSSETLAQQLSAAPLEAEAKEFDPGPARTLVSALVGGEALRGWLDEHDVEIDAAAESSAQEQTDQFGITGDSAEWLTTLFAAQPTFVTYVDDRFASEDSATLVGELVPNFGDDLTCFAGVVVPQDAAAAVDAAGGADQPPSELVDALTAAGVQAQSIGTELDPVCPDTDISADPVGARLVDLEPGQSLVESVSIEQPGIDPATGVPTGENDSLDVMIIAHRLDGESIRGAVAQSQSLRSLFMQRLTGVIVDSRDVWVDSKLGVIEDGAIVSAS